MGAVTVSLGIFVSCKDTSGDWYQELNGKFADNATLQEVVNKHKQDIEYLEGLIEELQGQVGKCECDPEVMAQLTQLAEDMQAANVDAEDLKNMKELMDQIINNYTTINNFITTLGVSKEELNAALDSLKKAMVAEYDLDSVKVMEERIISALNLAKDAGSRLDKIEPIVNDVKKIANDADSLSKDNKEKIGQINQKLADMDDRLQLMSDSLLHAYKTADSLCVVTTANKEAIEKLDSTVKADKEILDKLAEQVPELYNKVDSLGKEIEKLKPEITKLYNYADANLEKAKAYTDLEIALLRADINGLDVDLEALRKELGDNIFNLREDLNDAIDKLTDRIDENTLKIGELDKKLDSIAEDFKDSLAALRADLSDLEKRVKKNEEDIAELFGEVNILKENLKRQVTGIIIQGSYNPAFGTLRLPSNVQTNVLLSYFGYAYRDVYFPTSRTANYVDETKVLTDKDMEMIGGEGDKLYSEADLIMLDEENNAGTLYLTVNPNTVDFSKLQLSIENSKGETSKIQLGELKRSEKLLEFGYTRADNGFYEAPAFLAKEDVNTVQKINFNTESVKDAVREIMQKGTSADPKKLATDLVDFVKGFKADANCVKCEWQDSVKEGEEPVVHSVRSDYNLMATAIKPFSLQTLKGVEPLKAFPGYNRVMSLINRASSKIKNEITVAINNVQGQPVVKKIQGLTINQIADLNGVFLINKKVTIDGLEYTLGAMEVDIPIVLTDVPVDLGTINVPVPSLAINGSAQTAEVLVNVYVDPNLPAGTGAGQLDNPANIAGTAKVPAQNVVIAANSTATNVPVTIDGKTITINKNMHTTINMNKVLKFGDKDPVTGEPTSSKTFEINVDITPTINEIWGNVQGSVNPTLTQVEAIVKDVNTLLGELNNYRDAINTKVDNYTDQLASYVTRINNKLVSFVNNFNDRLQPVLAASDGKGSKVLSEAPEYPTEMGSDINFAPTTWTLELAVPLAKKHVAIVDVIDGTKSAKNGDATCLAELKRANGSPTLNTVLSGDTRRVYATGLKSGYVYEIAYSALDFHGKVAARKYYIKIK